jgi:hypothetical protein
LLVVTRKVPERALCTELLGARPTAAGVEDLLWSIAMLPEFQMVN